MILNEMGQPFLLGKGVAAAELVILDKSKAPQAAAKPAPQAVAAH